MNGSWPRRVFVVVWVVLGIAGALDATVAKKLLGTHFDLVLPHLRYGHVMFNKNPHQVRVYEYAGPDGTRHEIADLVETPALGYRHARVSLDILTQLDYLVELCFRSFASRHEELTFYGDEYQVDVDPRRPVATSTFRCDAHGLTAN